ncbi:Glycosyl transferases group 1 [Microlunatus sagamiharensis]|uniref:Glycosyl transferases group 1 n=1 Tax=Microlunatus sagamiharensis TaxID=546874 RepID=A0A1H2NEK8_9ACTN|nr:glycosyltransferase [Microlunatus sagamiharensis]SDV03840.1 Glycosyl transferases group 1 [Microlunatus sagamiharensis]
MRILLSDVHGGYTDAFVAGAHDYEFLPAVDGRGGLSRLGDAVPPRAREVEADVLRDDPPDVVVLQRPEDAATVEEQTGLRPGRDVPALFLEHNTPKESVPNTRHPAADGDLLVVHVTHLNALLWDCGTAPTTVVEHGLADPGLRYDGSLPHLAFVVNEPVRRWRVTGTDLLTRFAPAPVDAFGIDADLLPAALDDQPGVAYAGNVKPPQLRDALVQRRAYLHLNRWTSLGLSLIESMLLGLPVVVLETTVAARTVPPAAGAISPDPAELVTAARRLLADPDAARAAGLVAREAALERHGLDRFLADWDRVLADVASR